MAKKKDTNEVDAVNTEEQKKLEAQKPAEQEEQARLQAEREKQEREAAELAAKLEAEKLKSKQKNTVTMLNPVIGAEPHEAEVHPDMIKHWEQDGWKVK